MLLAFLVNFAGYPLVGSLLAYVAKDIYGLGQTGLAWLIAAFAGGALAGSIGLAMSGAWIRPARTMIASAVIWFGLNLVFSWVETAAWGVPLLFAAGFAQSLCMVTLAVVLLRIAGEKFGGRIMGVRMLAIYGHPMGLLIAGAMIERIGFMATATLFGSLGLSLIVLIALRWRADVLERQVA